MTDMAVVYGTLANLGKKVSLQSIWQVSDSRGKALWTNPCLDQHSSFSKQATADGQLAGRANGAECQEQVMPSGVAFLLTDVLSDNQARAPAFGSNSILDILGYRVAVKTGTSNNLRDNWTIGYTPSRLAAVWVGNNDNSSMSAVASGLTGASPIWNKITGFVLEKDNIDQEWPAKPEDVIGISVCNTSGKLPGDSGCPTRFEYFIKGKLPEKAGSEKETILINKDANSPVQPNEVAENVEYQEHPVVYDPLGTVFCLDCPIPQKAVIIRYPI